MKSTITLEIEHNANAAPLHEWNWHLLIAPGLPPSTLQSVRVIEPTSDPFEKAWWVVCATMRPEGGHGSDYDEWAVFEPDGGEAALKAYNKYLQHKDLVIACVCRVVDSTDHEGAGQDYIDRVIGTSGTDTLTLTGIMREVPMGFTSDTIRVAFPARVEAALQEHEHAPKDPAPPAKVVEAMRHVQEHCPSVTMVVYTPEQRWLYMDTNGEMPVFEGQIDVSLLEDAADAVPALPCIYHIPREPKDVTVRGLRHRLQGCNPDAVVYLTHDEEKADPDSGKKKHIVITDHINTLRWQSR